MQKCEQNLLCLGISMWRHHFGVLKICATLSLSYMSKDNWAGVKPFDQFNGFFSVWEDFGHGPHSCVMWKIEGKCKGMTFMLLPRKWLNDSSTGMAARNFCLETHLKRFLFPKNNHFLKLWQLQTQHLVCQPNDGPKWKAPLEGWRGKKEPYGASASSSY